MSYALAETAEALHCDERTLRRYANQGLLRGERRGRGELRLPYGEESYLREHWPLLNGLRRALRTEHSIRLAVLFGSTATGDDLPESDVDLLIDHSTGDLQRVAAFRRRLQGRIGRPLHLVLLEDARQSPVLLADILDEGRVVVDRTDAWKRLSRQRKAVLRAATAEEGAIHAGAREAVAEARTRIGA
jgi:predicted nucleotidyltransferase